MQAVNGHAGDATDGGEDEEKKAFGESFMNTKLMTNSKVRHRYSCKNIILF